MDRNDKLLSSGRKKAAELHHVLDAVQCTGTFDIRSFSRLNYSVLLLIRVSRVCIGMYTYIGTSFEKNTFGTVTDITLFASLISLHKRTSAKVQSKSYTICENLCCFKS